MVLSKKKIIFNILGSLVLIAMVVFFYNQSYIEAYYADMKAKPFSSGDKVYADNYTQYSPDTAIRPFYRIIKSKTTSEIGSLASDMGMKTSTYRSKKSTYFGHFIERKFFADTTTENGKISNVIIKLYAVEPDKTLVTHLPKPKLPAGFEYIDDKYYVLAILTFTENQFNKY